MQASLKLSAPVLALLAALGLAGCSTPSASPSQAYVSETESKPTEAETQVAAQPEREVAAEDKGRHHRDPDGDDYRAVDGGTLYLNEPGWKGQRQLEKEKIHRLAKLCIQANNTSAPCQDIIRTNARMGKFYILQESEEMTPDLKKWEK